MFYVLPLEISHQILSHTLVRMEIVAGGALIGSLAFTVALPASFNAWNILYGSKVICSCIGRICAGGNHVDIGVTIQTSIFNDVCVMIEVRALQQLLTATHPGNFAVA